MKKAAQSDDIRSRIKLKNLKSSRALYDKHPHVGEIFQKKGTKVSDLRGHSAKLLGASAVAGALLLAPPAAEKSLPSPREVVHNMRDQWQAGQVKSLQRLLTDSLAKALPKDVRPLSREEEKYLEQIIEDVVGVKARATLEGEHLNTTYGLIGLEQHLRRFPGDTIAQHGEGEVLEEGMAPGLGAWGYFAPTREALSEDLEETERWYAVVQTLYLEDWARRQPYLRDWYKYRKILIVNKNNGRAVVAAIADAGPAAWTGKHFGGSPEVMNYLGGDRYTKGPVVLFFVDDPDNEMPLGPVEYNKISLPEEALISA